MTTHDGATSQGFLSGAPTEVTAIVGDIIKIPHGSATSFFILLRAPRGQHKIIGVNFGAEGSRGQHVFITRPDARVYRKINRRNRCPWSKLPPPVRAGIVCYLRRVFEIAG